MVSGDAEGECSAVLGRIEPRGSNARIVQSAVIGVTGLTITSKPGIATRFPCTRGRCRGNTEGTEGACGGNTEGTEWLTRRARKAPAAHTERRKGAAGVRQALCACLAPSQGACGEGNALAGTPSPLSPCDAASSPEFPGEDAPRLPRVRFLRRPQADRGHEPSKGVPWFA